MHDWECECDFCMRGEVDGGSKGCSPFVIALLAVLLALGAGMLQGG